MLKLFADYHTHTCHSHGQGTVPENIEAARRRGLQEVAITDHGPGMLPWLAVKSPDTLLAIKEETRACNRVHPGITALAGVEANVIGVDGELDVPVKVLSQLDLVLAGLHLMVVPPSVGDGLRLMGNNLWGVRISSRLARRARLDNTKALVEAVYRYPIDIITHPGLQLSIDTRELARACARKGTALEINSFHGYLTTDFVRVAAREGVSFAINSDAHRPEDVGRLEAGLAVAEKVGLEPDQVINAEPWKKGLPQRWQEKPEGYRS